MRQWPAELVPVLVAVRRHGLLLQTDARLPNVATLVVRGPVVGSWWGHPGGHDIFRVSNELAAHPDVLVAKLVSGKTTYVHRKLWPALLAVATARETWQTKGLSLQARKLLQRVDSAGEARASGDAARELEIRLLVYAEQIHTETGAHAKRLQSWRSRVPQVAPMDPGDGKIRLEQALDTLNLRFRAKGRLPWRRP